MLPLAMVTEVMLFREELDNPNPPPPQILSGKMFISVIVTEEILLYEIADNPNPAPPMT